MCTYTPNMWSVLHVCECTGLACHTPSTCTGDNDFSISKVTGGAPHHTIRAHAAEHAIFSALHICSQARCSAPQPCLVITRVALDSRSTSSLCSKLVARYSWCDLTGHGFQHSVYLRRLSARHKIGRSAQHVRHKPPGNWETDTIRTGVKPIVSNSGHAVLAWDLRWICHRWPHTECTS